MFDRIAPRYDLLNRLLSAGIDTRWRRRAVDALGLAADARVLDLCTGTADLLIEALGRGQERRGTGIDLSAAMLVRGAHKLRARGLSGRAGLACGDAERLPLASGGFEGALIAFGIRNVGDPEAALRELRRVLLPGGRLVILEFSMPPGLFGPLYRFYFGRVLPRIGGLLSGDPGAYAYLPASVARFPAPAAFSGMMTSCGFEGVTATALTAGIAHVYHGVRSA
jgi:demethylmenaquinone methyltransferase/2-methoxy-6-polyprenyl-1,4-benzoquinol methylase